MKKIALIGSVGYGEKTSSGQVIRTQILHNALIDHYGEKRVYLINTSRYSHHVINIMVKTFLSIFLCDTYIVILSGNGRKVFFPVLRLYKKIFRKRVLNNIIGGDYAESVRKYPKYIKYSNSFDVNWVQMPSMKKEVEAIGIINVEVLPNSKPLTIVDEKTVKSVSKKPFHFCTFSRVSKAKGIELAINAIKAVNEKAGSVVATLDIYGKPDEDYINEFKRLMNQADDFISYKGIVEYNKTTEVLKDYYMLLFPSTFYGEGFPGTIIDAYASALPVIASTWKYNSDLISDGETGYLYDYRRPQELMEKILLAISNTDIVNTMRYNCAKEATRYIPEMVMPIVFSKIENSWR